MERTYEEIYQTLKQRPELMDLFRIYYSAPEDKRPELLRAAWEVLGKITQKEEESNV